MKWISCAAALAVFLLMSCTEASLEVAVFSYNNQDPFIARHVEQIISIAPENFEIELFDASNSQIIQNEQIESLLSSPPDLVIINPVDRTAAYTIINSFKATGTPVIFFNREPLPQDLDLWDQVYYIGARATQSAELQAELISPLFGENPDDLNEYDLNGDDVIQAIILKGEPGHQDAEIRTRVVQEHFAELGYRLEVLSVESANWNGDEAYQKIDALLPVYGERMEVILSNNDVMAIGAIRRLRQAGYFQDLNDDGMIDRANEPWFPVVGIDGIDAAAESINAGYLYGSVRNDSATMSRAIVELMEVILGTRDGDQFGFTLDNRYVWIDYLPYTR